MSSDAPIQPEVIRRKISTLRQRVEAAEDDLRRQIAVREAEIERLRTELTWWETGQRLFFNEEDEATHPGPDASQTRTGRPASSGAAKPTLRNAILTVLGEDQPPKARKTADIISALEERGWMPTGTSAEHHVRSLLAQMHRRGQAKRVGHGVYALPDALDEAPEPSDDEQMSESPN